MNELIKIGNREISIKEWQGQRVVTFKDIDFVHNRPEGTARKRFADNREHFIEGEDFFVITPQSLENTKLSEKRTFENLVTSPRGMALITEQGYLMLVKSFTDDLAWTVQRQLVNGYFRSRQIVNEELSPQMQVLMNMVSQMAENELAQKRMQAQLDKQEQSIEAIKDATRPVLDDWRSEINKKVNYIKDNSNKPYGVLRAEMYRELEERAGVDLDTRLKNLRNRLRDNGASATAIKNTNSMDVIEQDKKLREIFGKIVSEYEIKYCA